MTTRVLPTDHWPPAVGALLYDFETGQAIPRAEHKTWLKANVVAVLRGVSCTVRIWGAASKAGWPRGDPREDARRNRQLSRLRVDNVLQFLAGHRPKPWRVLRQHLGSSIAPGGKGDNRERERSVALLIEPRAAPRLAAAATRRAVARFKAVITSFGGLPGHSQSGEARELWWGRRRDRLLGFGLAMRAYTHGAEEARTTVFSDRIRLVPKKIRNRRGRNSGAWKRGEDDAFGVWKGLSTDQRWNLSRPAVRDELLRKLCLEFRRFYVRIVGARRWEAGTCEFYTAGDEKREPLTPAG